MPTDTVVDIFGKFGLAAALCAGGYKYKIVCLNEQNFLFVFASSGRDAKARKVL